MAKDPAKLCGAKLRKKDRTCRQPAGYKTPHVGEGRCWLHGGLTPVKHGRYSKIKGGRIRTLLDELKEHDQNVMDLEPEAQMLRAMLIDYIERYEEINDALLDWHKEYQKANKSAPLPHRPLELHDAQNLVEGISRVVERIHKITSSGAIQLDAFRHLMSQMGAIVAQHVNDDDALQRIEADWMGLVVNPRNLASYRKEVLEGADESDG